ncbi:MAG: replicative DNA helicase [Candidatus Dojkabacteria bacterium]|nr:replicative DNA helicase [Candidatus Dojkabacteria bacterium]MDQ7021712.1 replicative DNA helicase [Candidatus Dojkabacteria bacterium]
MSNLKVPPQNIEAEKAVIGSVLIDNSVLPKIADLITHDDFYDPKHQLIFEHIMMLYGSSKAVDSLTLTGELKKSKKLSQSGGAVYLSEIISEVPTAANVVEYADIVKETSMRRRLITFGAELTEKAREEDKKIDDIIDELEGNILKVSRNSTKTDYYDAPTLLELQMKKADEYAKNPNAMRGIATGLKDLNYYLGGLHKSDLIILAARPSVGKSALAIHLARYAAVNEAKSILFFSLEMPAVQIIERMLAQEMKVNLWNLRMGKLSDDDYRKYSEASGKLSESRVYVDETAGISLMQLRSKARKVAMEKGLDLVVVDYLQLMQTRDIENRSQAVGEISRSLKIMARELEIPVIALSQLNRAVENRSDRVPQLSDLRESGSIEQDADIVLFLSRDYSEDDEADDEIKTVDLTIAKHRNGATGGFKLRFVGAQQIFLDVERE